MTASSAARNGSGKIMLRLQHTSEHDF